MRLEHPKHLKQTMEPGKEQAKKMDLYRDRRRKEVGEWQQSWKVCVGCGGDNRWNHKQRPIRHEDKLCKECYVKEGFEVKDADPELHCLPCGDARAYGTHGPVEACPGFCREELGHPGACICFVCSKVVRVQQDVTAESNASSASGLKPKPKKETKIAEPKPKKEKKSAESSASSASGLKHYVEALICWPDSD